MISSVIDHVAIAVPDRQPAIKRYLGHFGGGSVASGRRAGFTIDQVSFSRGTKLEIVGPDPKSEDRRRTNDFLKKYGSVIHHVTVLVESVGDAVSTLEAAGVHPVGIRLDDPRYQEAFVLPQQGGGVMVQITWKDVDDAGWAQRYGHTPTPPQPYCPDFIGVRWSQPNLGEISEQWRILGGDVSMNHGVLSVSWGSDCLRFEYVEGEPRGLEELIFEGAPTLPSSIDTGPAVVPVGRARSNLGA